MRRRHENDVRERQNDVQKRQNMPKCDDLMKMTPENVKMTSRNAQNVAKMRRRHENAKVGLVGACFVLYNCPMLDKREGVGAKMRRLYENDTR